MTEHSILAHPNGTQSNQNIQSTDDEFSEIGTPGLSSFGGYITQAYNAKLNWPSVEPLYSRIWRSCPETAIVRTIFSALTGNQELTWELPRDAGGKELDEPTDDDKRQLDFAHSLTVDIRGGLHKWLSECNVRTAFFGFGVWEMPLGLRREGWNPDNGSWESKFDDGLVGLRKIAFRDYSSFSRWEMDDYSGDVTGFIQNDPPNSERTIPIDRLLHIVYGDSTNPEGLATMEALWRLERILYQYQLIHGIGSEHAAGHVKFTVRDELDTNAKSAVSRAARAMLTAQEGSYITEIMDKFTADIMDTTFRAAGDILEAIRHYSLLKLSLYGMQFAGMNTMTGTGSFAALQDSSSMALLLFNSMSGGFVKQASQQIGERIFMNPTNMAAFPNATRLPVLKVSKIEKVLGLAELGSFTQAMSTVFPLGDDDQVAIRRKSGVLPEQIPDDAIVVGEKEAVIKNEPPDNSDQGEDMDMDMQQWWKLRQEIYSTTRGNRVELIARLDDATTVAELSVISAEIGNG